MSEHESEEAQRHNAQRLYFHKQQFYVHKEEERKRKEKARHAKALARASADGNGAGAGSSSAGGTRRSDRTRGKEQPQYNVEELFKQQGTPSTDDDKMAFEDSSTDFNQDSSEISVRAHVSLCVHVHDAMCVCQWR